MCLSRELSVMVVTSPYATSRVSSLLRVPSLSKDTKNIFSARSSPLSSMSESTEGPDSSLRYPKTDGTRYELYSSARCILVPIKAYFTLWRLTILTIYTTIIDLTILMTALDLSSCLDQAIFSRWPTKLHLPWAYRLCGCCAEGPAILVRSLVRQCTIMKVGNKDTLPRPQLTMTF